jgi:hypothetical protein
MTGASTSIGCFKAVPAVPADTNRVRTTIGRSSRNVSIFVVSFMLHPLALAKFGIEPIIKFQEDPYILVEIGVLRVFQIGPELQLFGQLISGGKRCRNMHS